ncbi:hypothetical protein MSAN_00149900 [Mycena sanguinolenta]|uniref:Uncharacterized protein n=1 Tax=Mycena sanguinolenta TaxID=230812 RepID=A0A8H6ZE10_9AGAR|nr:hypothetical protein MSAN_00149900 [Mycena sanguinolenta]
MMLSARKLGAVMGTTPVLLDLEPSPPAQSHSMVLVPPLTSTVSRASHRSKREGVILTPRSSTSSSASFEKIDLEPEPLPSVAKLSLSRETRNSLQSVTRLRLVLTLTQPSPSTDPYSSNCPYPSSSTDSLDVLQRSLSILISAPPPTAPDHAARRKKMVKLVNMLGGPIPTSVVFPPPNPRPQSRTERAARRRSRSVPPPTSTPAARPRKLVRTPPAVDIVLPALSVDRISHPRPLAAYAPLRSASSSPLSNRTTSSSASRGRPVTPYSLRRRGRESTPVSES